VRRPVVGDAKHATRRIAEAGLPHTERANLDQIRVLKWKANRISARVVPGSGSADLQPMVPRTDIR